MNIIKQMINDKAILDEYAKIDKINPYPSNHGMKHILNVLKIIDDAKSAFKLNAREVLILKVSAIFHDIGQVEGRYQHGLRGRHLAEKYEPIKAVFSDEEQQIIYDAIETHDEYKSYDIIPSRYSWVLNIVDKLDFSRNRLEDNYLEKFGYSIYADIKKVKFKKLKNGIKVVISTIHKPKIITIDGLFKQSLFTKAVDVLKHYGIKYNTIVEVWLDNQKLDLKFIDTSKILDDGDKKPKK